MLDIYVVFGYNNTRRRNTVANRICGCGGTGRRAGLRNQYQRCGGSSPLIRTNNESVRTTDTKINQKINLVDFFVV